MFKSILLRFPSQSDSVKSSMQIQSGPVYGLSWPDGFDLWHVLLEISGIPKLWTASVLIWKVYWDCLLTNRALAQCWHPTLEHGAWQRAWCPLWSSLASATVCHVCPSMKTKNWLDDADVQMPCHCTGPQRCASARKQTNKPLAVSPCPLMKND